MSSHLLDSLRSNMSPPRGDNSLTRAEEVAAHGVGAIRGKRSKDGGEIVKMGFLGGRFVEIFARKRIQGTLDLFVQSFDFEPELNR